MVIYLKIIALLLIIRFFSGNIVNNYRLLILFLRLELPKSFTYYFFIFRNIFVSLIQIVALVMFGVIYMENL